jgi:phage shock protein A
MSLLRRVSDAIQQRLVRAPEQEAGDPVKDLEKAYQQQLIQLQQVRRNVADVVTAKKRLEIHGADLQRQADHLQEQARSALREGREDQARAALTRAQVAQSQLTDLRQQIGPLNEQEQQLQLLVHQLQTKVEAFRTQREALRARHTAAQATLQAGQVLSGLTEEMDDANRTVARARERTDQAQAQASAIQGLIGRPEEGLPASASEIDRQLQLGSGQAHVEAQLQAMRAQMELPDTVLVVRIQGEGQYRLARADAGKLEVGDRNLTSAIESGDEERFRTAVNDLLGTVRSLGSRLDANDLRPSDIVLPAPDMSLEEAKRILDGG